MKGKENFIFSPYSIHKAFAVVMLGAKENTRKELAKALTLNTENEKIVEDYERITKTLKYNSLKEVSLNIVVPFFSEVLLVPY